MMANTITLSEDSDIDELVWMRKWISEEKKAKRQWLNVPAWTPKIKQTPRAFINFKETTFWNY